MMVHAVPTAVEKLALVGDSTRFEPVGDNPRAERGKPIKFMPGHKSEIPVSANGVQSCITAVQTPKGPKPVLKAMMTTACEKNCYYCPFRAGRGQTRRVTFQPDEMAGAFHQLEQARLVDGIFLSSGIIKGGVTTQDKIIDTIEIIRRKYQYSGYIHLKIMPGAERDQLRRAMELADRVSINLEGPTDQRLRALAPMKDFEGDLLEHIGWAHDLRREANDDPLRRLRASVVTQFVMGAVGDTDLELLSLSERLYRQMGLKRAYYSAFNPVEHTPFENLDPASPLREFRLYQASFLLRDYAWDVEDLPFEGAGNLRQDVDPKRAWADERLRDKPIEVMTASKQELMRVPGIGPKGAQKIVRARRKGQLSDLSQLRAIGIAGPERAAPYILLGGHQPPQQLALFD